MARLLSLALVFSAGCSFALGGPDPERPKNKPPQCDTGKGLVVVDALMATALGLTAIGLAGSSNSSERSAALGPLIFGGIYAGAALRGNNVVNECRRSMDEYIASSEPAPELSPMVKPKKRIVERERPAVEPAVAPPEPPPPAAPTPQQPQPAPTPAPARPKAEPKPTAEPSPWGEFWKELP